MAAARFEPRKSGAVSLPISGCATKTPAKNAPAKKKKVVAKKKTKKKKTAAKKKRH
jgi:hypothetical protein